MTEFLCLGLIAPIVWGAVVFGLRRAVTGGTVGSSRDEVFVLAVLVAPIVLGLLWIALSHGLPVHMTQPFVMAIHPATDTAAGLGHVMSANALHGLWSWIAPALVCVYLAGVAVNLVPLASAFLRLRQIVACAVAAPAYGQTVRLTDAPVPPFAWGRQTVVLPRSLTAHMTPHDVALVISHETQHLRRRDPIWFAVLGWLDALLWLNPFVRLQTARCRLAAELACDAAVIAAAPELRAPYAKALLQAVKHGAGGFHPYAPAMASPSSEGLRLRLMQIVQPSPHKPKARSFYAAVLLAFLPLTVAQFAWSQALSDPEKMFAGIWSGPADAQIEAKYDVNLLHRRIGVESRDDAWAGAAEAALNRDLVASLVEEGRAPYFRATCQATLCETVAVVNIENKSDAQINQILDRYYAANHKLAYSDHFRDDSSGVLSMDATNGKPAKHMYLLWYAFRK